MKLNIATGIFFASMGVVMATVGGKPQPIQTDHPGPAVGDGLIERQRDGKNDALKAGTKSSTRLSNGLRRYSKGAAGDDFGGNQSGHGPLVDVDGLMAKLAGLDINSLVKDEEATSNLSGLSTEDIGILKDMAKDVATQEAEISTADAVAKFDQVSEALLTLFVATKDEDMMPTYVKDLIFRAVGATERIKDATLELDAIEAEKNDMKPKANQIKDSPEEVDALTAKDQASQTKAEQQRQRRTHEAPLDAHKESQPRIQQEEETPAKENPRKNAMGIKAHPHIKKLLSQSSKFRKHVGLHESLANGDASVIDAHIRNFHDSPTMRDASGSAVGDVNQYQRALQLDPTAVGGAEEECVTFVKCLYDWTIYDVLTYFYFDDINEAGGIAEKTSDFDAKNVLDKGRQITQALKMFAPDPNINLTPDLPGKCNSLMKLFYRNKEHDGYVEHQAGTWRDVCRAEGNTRYVSFEAITQHFGNDLASLIFEDFVLCSASATGNSVQIQDVPMFFDPSGIARVPISIRADGVDQQGKLLDATDPFNYEYLSIIDTLPVNAGTPFDDVRALLANVPQTCKRAIDSHYTDLTVGDMSPRLHDGSNDRHYPKVNLQCLSNYTNGAMGTWSCGIFIEGVDITECSSKFQNSSDICPHVSKPNNGVAGCEDRWVIASLYTAATNKDKAATLLLGEKVSNGLVCAHDQAPGFCCLDDPGEDFHRNLWGDHFNCEMGESSCKKLGPVLSGFSAESCSVYSGTYCLRPRNCSMLVDCVEKEKGWAFANDKYAYHEYLNNTPEVKNVAFTKECGAVREYFGFDENYPDDQEICDDIKFLRFNRDFESLNAFAAQEVVDFVAAEPATMPPALTNPPTTEANTNAPVAELGTVLQFSANLTKPGVRTEAQHNALAKTFKGLYQFQQVLSTLEELLYAAELFDCPVGGPAFWVFENMCIAVQNILRLILLIPLFIAGKIYNSRVYTYEDADCIAENARYQIFEWTAVIYNNTETLESHASVIRNNQHVLRENQNILRTQINGIGSQNTENMKDINAAFSASNTHVSSEIDRANRFVGEIRREINDNLQSWHKNTQSILTAGPTGHDALYKLIEEKTKVLIAKIREKCDTELQPAVQTTLSNTRTLLEDVRQLLVEIGKTSTPTTATPSFSPTTASPSNSPSTSQPTTTPPTYVPTKSPSTAIPTLAVRRLLEADDINANKFGSKKPFIVDCGEVDSVPTVEVPHSASDKGHQAAFILDHGHQGAYLLDSIVFKNATDVLLFLNDTLRVATAGFARPGDLGVDLLVTDTSNCKVTVDAVPTHASRSDGSSRAGPTNSFTAAVDEKPPVVTCGFHGGVGNHQDQSTLYVDEGRGKVDTGLFYNITDTCSKVVNVVVSVRSNELEEAKSAFLALAEDAGEETAKVFVAPRLCPRDEQATDSVCIPSTSGRRVYDVTVKATDEAGNDATATCHVIVMPRSSEGIPSGSDAFGLPAAKEEPRALAKSSSVKTVVGVLSFQQRLSHN